VTAFTHSGDENPQDSSRPKYSLTLSSETARSSGGPFHLTHGLVPFEAASTPSALMESSLLSSAHKGGCSMPDENGEDQTEGDPDLDPRARLMQEVAAEMDSIENDFGDDYQIGRVITIVEIVRPDDQIGLRVRAGQYPWVTLGMLRAAQRIVESQLDGPGSD
jgi:hypothetical protein